MNPFLVLTIALSIPVTVDSNQKTLFGCSAPCAAAVKMPIIIEVNDFTDESSKQFSAQMTEAQKTGQSIIPIVIDSNGGSVFAFLKMVSIIQSSKVPVATIVEGRALSCGALLLMMGKEGYRFAGPQAIIMLHDISGEMKGKEMDLASHFAESQRESNLVFSITSKNTGHTENFFTNLMDEKKHADVFLDANEAKRLNIVNKIGIPEFKVMVNIDYIFETNVPK